MTFLKLVDFEMKRIWKLFASLLGLMMIVQLLVVTISSFSHAHSWKEAVRKGYSIDRIGLEGVTQSLFFYFPIALIIVSLLIYVFLTWYREWFGKNTFAYQLLLLPGNRMNIYFAKLVSILLYIFCSVVVQMALYPVFKGIFSMIMPAAGTMPGNFRSWIGSDPLLYILIPVNGSTFLFYYGVGITSVLVLFCMILLERSYGIAGIAAAVLYGFVCLLFVLLPTLINNMIIPLYAKEYAVIFSISWALIVLSAIALSAYVINKKIAV
ncbi:hypothetical protein [Bacillus testis]|uniref:hypothetical protein n=1 Tax=Bacillus testis TaxID=1622072 RepID=UPI00067F022D|nr:hypothetical protein [Bacillus testis]